VLGHVALLRGINVGGKHKLPMALLVELFEQAGARDVRTYIQSGNVVFRASAAAAAKLPDKLHAELRARVGFDAPITTRTAAELATVARDNPYLAAGVDQAQVYVAFLAARPTAAAVASLDARRSAPDAFTVVGREVYLHLPGNVARTKLTNAYFDSKLKTVSTMRNWATVLALLELVTS
jgi:uncharacterized protein (DUF1697 family)